MLSSQERKILALRRMLTRTKRQRDRLKTIVASQLVTIELASARYLALATKVRGDSALAAISPDLMACYQYAIEHMTSRKARVGSTISTWKDPTIHNEPDTNLGSRQVVDWLVTEPVPGVYDLEFKREWTY